MPLIPLPAELDSGFGLTGTAFYDDLPVTAVWMDYQESLLLVADLPAECVARYVAEAAAQGAVR
jgi:hypothetical protein